LADVRLVNLTKIFESRGERVVAVDHINLHIQDKEFLVLLGPSGCGKTTTLRMIAGLEVPTEGEIYIGGKLVNDLHPKDRDISMVFQNYALYPHLSVFDNIAFPLKIRKYPKEEVRRRVEEVAELLRIRHLLNRKPKELSGGEQQRVALGRAIIRRPKVFLMDEPLSNLDAKLRILMRAELKKLQKELGVTTIYVTHDQVEAMTMADRVAVMNMGRIMQVGTPPELFNKPSNIFVAGFIGAPPMNFFECSVKEINGVLYLESDVFKYKVSSELASLLRRVGVSEVVIGIRPHDVKVSREPVENAVEAETYVIEPLGTETILDFKLGADIIKAVVPPTTDIGPGEKVWLIFEEERLHIFDKESQESIYKLASEEV